MGGQKHNLWTQHHLFLSQEIGSHSSFPMQGRAGEHQAGNPSATYLEHHHCKRQLCVDSSCICVCMCVCVYIYIYIERERERDLFQIARSS